MEVGEISRIFDNVTNRDITEIHFKSKHNQSIKFETEKEVLNISMVLSLCIDNVSVMFLVSGGTALLYWWKGFLLR